MADKQIMKPNNSTLALDPKTAIEEGTKAANALMDLVNKRKLAVNISGKKYLKFEAWQTIARFYGYTVKTAKTAYVKYNSTQGFEATASVIQTSNGRIVGAAEAICMNDEKNWKGRPLYAIKSMAQTRASAKALRQVLAWVAVLAGFEATPAEEMSVDNGSDPDPEWIRGKEDIVKTIALATEPQKKKIFALAKVKKWDADEVHKRIKKRFDLKSFNDLTKAQASEIIESINGSNPTQKTTQQAGETRICPQCGSEMWDNRPKKASGEFKKNSPDFKCKNKDCEFVIWPKKTTRVGGGR